MKSEVNKAAKVNKFIRLLTEKCKKENANFEKEFPKIKEYNKLEKDEYLFALQDAQIFKEKFLMPHYKIYNLLQVLNQEIEYLRKRELTEEEINKSIDELEEIKTQLANSRLEIFFCNVFDNEVVKKLANIAMPFGLLHVGLMVDDVIVQWGRSVLGKSIVNPSHDVIYNDYIFAIELENQPIWSLIKETYDNLRDYITNKKDIKNMGTIKAFQIADHQLTIFAERAVKYNTIKDYNLISKNCQNFAKTTVEKLGLKINKDGEVGKILKITQEKLNPFTFNFKGKEFKTRKDLDAYVLINKFEDFNEQERRLLFCYRNVFDYRARFKPDEEQFKSSKIAQAYWNYLAEKEKFG